MYKIIGADQKEYGPVSADQICQWIAEGRANGQTRVLADGTTDWKSLGELPEFAAALAAKFRPPVTPPLSAYASPAPSLEALAGRQVSLSIGSCFSRSWALYCGNFPFLLGIYLAGVVAALLVSLIGIFIPIPIINSLIIISFTGVINAGVFWTTLKLARGEGAAFGDLFAGFQRCLGLLLLGSLLTGVFIPLGAFCCALPGLFLYLIWIFALPIIIDLQPGAWDAMELSRKVVLKNFWSVLVLAIINGLLVMIIPAIGGLIGLSTLGPLIEPPLSSFLKQSGVLQAANLPPDFVPMMVSFMSFFLGYSLGGVVSKPIVAPFTTGALVYAYEDLLGSKPGPSA